MFVDEIREARIPRFLVDEAFLRFLMKKTALITGASSGIGWELALQYARGGYDLIITARREDKLRELAALLEPKVKVTVLPLDLTLPNAAQTLFDSVENRPIDVLINNAGFADYGCFVDSDWPKLEALLQLNIVALTQITRLFLPAMIARKRGRIVNVASTAAFVPGPLMSVYYASKAYVLSFSEALDEELIGTGVGVTALCPGPTQSEFQARAGMANSKLVRGMLMSSSIVARAGYRGARRRKRIVVLGFTNFLVTEMPRILPRKTVAQIVRRAQAMIAPEH